MFAEEKTDVIVIRTMSVAPLGVPPIRVFNYHERAAAHLCDHVLTRPEAHFWAGLLAKYEEHLDPADEEVLFAFARALWNQPPAPGGEQALYDAYAHAIEQAVRDALAHRWYFISLDEQGWPVWHGLGKQGIYVLCDAATVKTAMLLPYAAPNVEVSDKERRTNPLPRQNTWLYRGAKLRDEDTRYPELPAETSRDELAYWLFRKSITDMRREFNNAGLEYQDKVAQPVNALRKMEFQEWQQLQ